MYPITASGSRKASERPSRTRRRRSEAEIGSEVARTIRGSCAIPCTTFRAAAPSGATGAPRRVARVGGAGAAQLDVGDLEPRVARGHQRHHRVAVLGGRQERRGLVRRHAGGGGQDAAEGEGPSALTGTLG